MARIRANNGSGGGGGSNAYKEIAQMSGQSGTSRGCVMDTTSGTGTAGNDVTGDYLYMTYESTNMVIKAKAGLVGTIDVDYYSFTGNGSVTLNSGTFSAGETIVTCTFAGGGNKSCFAGVK